MDKRAAEEAEQRMREEVRKIIDAEQLRQQRYGNVRPVVAATFQGHRFVAVGNRLYYDKNWKNFTDFLFFYVKDVMGQEWWEAESAKRPNDRHPIVKWHDHLVDVSRGQRPDPETGFLSAVKDGILSALLTLAYDLYVLRNYSKLQDEVVARLCQHDQFQGARYELFVAATYIRAGCEIEYEDESDGSKKHAEFVAKHHASGVEMSVEAKARHRQMRGEFDMASIRPGVRDLLLSAADKRGDHPLVAFVELNLPPEDATKAPTWIPHVQAVVQEIAEQRGKPAFDLVILTNRPHLYGEVGEPDPSRHYYALWPHPSAIPEPLIETLGEAAVQYGNIPADFPKEFQV
ncbi:MAG TPA: hypothetical protein VFA27_05100 [Vicinamibacterales bacterium]|nr:hypothetical protein [Vicinamibacterales bacterium]